MATIAEFRLPAAETALETAFDRVPSLECEMEQVIAADDLGMWFAGADRSTIGAALDADPSVASSEHVLREGQRHLYNVRFSDGVTDLVPAVVDEGGTLLTATAANGIWTVRLRFTDRDSVGRVHDRLADRGITVDLTRLHKLSGAGSAGELGLTEEQYEALAAAIDHGYFDIPRRITLEELADEVGVSHQALSERLRRAYRVLATAKLNAHHDSAASDLGTG